MLQRSCAACGAAYQSNQPAKATCSTRCKSKGKRQRQGRFATYTLAHAGAYEAQCQGCRQTFVAHPKVRTIYCSRECYYSGRRTRPPARCAILFGICVGCGALFTSRRPRRTCSEGCATAHQRCGARRYAQHRWRTRNPLTPTPCEGCGVAFVREGQGPKRYCSPACRPEYPYSVSSRQRQMVYERDGWMCGLCRRPIDATLDPSDALAVTLDHVWPRSLGGDDSDANLQAAHRVCNSVKGNRVGAVQLRWAL